MTSRKTIIETIYKYSLELFYLLENKKITKSKLYEVILSNNKSQIVKIISKTKDINYFKYYKETYTKRDCIEEILFITDNRYKHLKEIKDIVNIDDIIEEVITDKIHYKKIKVMYTDRIIELLMEEYYDYKDIELFIKYKTNLIEIDKKINLDILKRIDKFYIKKITI